MGERKQRIEQVENKQEGTKFKSNLISNYIKYKLAKHSN